MAKKKAAGAGGKKSKKSKKTIKSRMRKRLKEFGLGRTLVGAALLAMVAPTSTAIYQRMAPPTPAPQVCNSEDNDRPDDMLDDMEKTDPGYDFDEDLWSVPHPVRLAEAIADLIAQYGGYRAGLSQLSATEQHDVTQRVFWAIDASTAEELLTNPSAVEQHQALRPLIERLTTQRAYSGLQRDASPPRRTYYKPSVPRHQASTEHRVITPPWRAWDD